MTAVSFMSANFVARQLGYSMSEGWMQGDRATNDFFAPLPTFADRFDALLGEVTELGFDRIDLWTAHINWRWATPEHLALARAALQKRRLRVASYAGGFGSTIAEFRAACRVAAALDIPVLGGGTSVLASDRAAMVAALREFGLVFGLENHPEKSPAELLAKLGDGDDDVIGVAVDTGWFGTQAYDAAAALRELAPRLKHLHLKDVRAAGAHETCRLGTGVVPVEACIHTLSAIGYAGVVSIEHEPEHEDPRADVAASLAAVRAWQRPTLPKGSHKPLRVAVVGCGNISNTYGSNLQPYPEVAIVGAQDIDPDRARQFTSRFGGKVWSTLDEVLADPDVDAVLNLTIHHAHVDVITRCLQARKHVHTEKPMALSTADARALVRLARKSRRRLSSAPSTWLGESQQTAWKLIRDGSIGTPRVAYAECNWGRIEAWHPNPGPFYDVGILFDVAVYPLTLLTAWFGAVRLVTAVGKVVYPDRHTKDGTPFTITTPELQVAVLEFESGLVARVTGSFYVGRPSRQRGTLEVHGDLGSIALDQWDNFSAKLFTGPFGGELRPVQPVRDPFPGTEFARGAVEMARAIQEKRPHRCGAEHAAHVIEVIDACSRAISTRRPQKVRSSFAAPAPMEWAS